MSEFKIEKGIPMPVRHTKKYPLEAMEIGDSFFVERATSQSMGGIFALHRPKKFSVRKRVENNVSGIRVWRVK